MSDAMPEGLKQLAAATEQEAKHDPDMSEDFRALLSSLELFHTADHRGYARIQVRDHKENWALKSVEFGRYLKQAYFKLKKQAINSQKLNDWIGYLEGKAQYEGKMQPVFTRIGAIEGKLYLDLGDEAWRVVEIDVAGYRVLDEPPIMFRRKHGMKGLPIPVASKEIAKLRQFLNLGSEQDWILVLSFLVACMKPTGPYPILVLQGEQGCGKSFVTRILRALIDPAMTSLRSPPRCEQDMVLAASNSWLLGLDNLSGLRDWLSDALCRLATGGGFSTRELYSNEEEVLLDVQRPVIINGIDDLATRPDLLDRAIVVTLPVIGETERKTEGELWREFELERPQILGALLNAVSGALRASDSVIMTKKPRMADFAIWATAAEEGLGLLPGAFIKAYTASSHDSMSLTLENNLVGQILLQVAREVTLQGEWTGTMTELRSLIEAKATDRGRNRPASPQALGNQIRRIQPMLRKAGVYVIGPERAPGGRRVYTMTYHDPNKSSQSSQSSLLPDDALIPAQRDNSDNSDNMIGVSTIQATPPPLSDVASYGLAAGGGEEVYPTSESSEEWMELISDRRIPGAIQ